MATETTPEQPVGAPHVIVGVDGSPESVEALAWAARYAAATGATINAVHAWHYPPAGPVRWTAR